MSNIVPLADIQAMAEVAAGSRMFGFKNPQEAMAIMLLCQAEDLHPAIAMRDYHVIQGRPALKADAMLARFQQAGGAVQWKEYTDEKVTGLFSHPAGGSLEVTWTLAKAKLIGIANKDNWKNYSRAMLRARCVSEGIRSVYPGCVVGVYTPEEVQDFEPAPKDLGKVQEVSVAPVSIETIEEDIPVLDNGEISTPKGNLGKMLNKYPLYIPGADEPYAVYLNTEDWQEGFFEISKKIYESSKYDDKTKLEKHNALRDANEAFMKSWNGTQTAKLLEKIATLRRR